MNEKDRLLLRLIGAALIPLLLIEAEKMTTGLEKITILEAVNQLTSVLESY